MSCESNSFLVGAAAVFAIVGGILNDRLGRKPTTLFASFVFILGALLLAAAVNKWMLLIGRFILGVGIGTYYNIYVLYMYSL